RLSAGQLGFPGRGGADGPGGAGGARADCGRAYVIPGGAALASLGTLDLALGPVAGGFCELIGAGAGDTLGEEAAVSDLDGDGAPGLVVGASTADGEHDARGAAGGCWVLPSVHVRPGATLDMLRPPLGASVLFAPTAGDLGGHSLHAADLDGDGFGDLVV